MLSKKKIFLISDHKADEKKTKKTEREFESSSDNTNLGINIDLSISNRNALLIRKMFFSIR